MSRPSGEQFEITFGGQRAVCVELGGGLRTYEIDGRDVVDGYRADEKPTAGRGQLLVPWPNRIQDGRYEFGGRRHQLALSEPEHGNAIHGLARRERWQLAKHESHRVVLVHELQPQPGYPFSLDLEVGYELSPHGLVVRMSATNAGRESCPYGAGAHPYLRPEAPTVDEAVLRLPARTVLDTNERKIPVGSSSVAGTELDFRAPRPIGALRLDHCFTDLERDDEGRARVLFEGLELWADNAFPYLMVYTGDASPDVARASLAVEPMTCPPNAFRSGEALVVLEPGASHTATWGLTPG
jgi:aldose 1-epimerase